MAIKNGIYQVDNGVDFDEINFRTIAEQVICKDGKTVDASLAEIKNSQYAKICNKNDISIPDSISTRLSFNSKLLDTNNIYNPGNTTRLTCKKEGFYLIKSAVSFDAHPTGFREIFMKLTSSLEASNIAGTAVQAVVDTRTLLEASTMWYMLVGDYVEVYVTQNSGNALNVKTDLNTSPGFMLSKIG